MYTRNSNAKKKTDKNITKLVWNYFLLILYSALTSKFIIPAGRYSVVKKYEQKMTPRTAAIPESYATDRMLRLLCH